ncbi:MAG TPA: hemolysin family protein [Mycobacteriales bacterium]
MSTWLSVLVVVVLILVEGVFVAAEISLISLRESQVNALAEAGPRGQRVARLVRDPNRFLASVQIGVTLTALLSSAFGAITLSRTLARALRRAGLGNTLAEVVGFLVVTLLISFVTLVIGELAPKRIALQRAQSVAQTLSGPLDVVARVSRPVIWLLSRSTDAVVRVFGGDPGTSRQAITDEELRGLVAAHQSLSGEERKLIDDVFSASERTVREVMVPRTEVQFLEADQLAVRAAKKVLDQPHSRYPVAAESYDDIVGFVHVRDLYAVDRRSKTVHVGDVARPVKLLPETKAVLPAMAEMRREGHHLAIVVDEYGGTAGIVTLEDLIEEVVGEIRDEYDEQAQQLRTLRGGDLEVDGLLNLEDFAEVTGVALPDGHYETAAGFVVAALGHVPRVGEAVVTGRTRLTVTRVDGRRVERLRVARTEPATDVPAEEPVADG